MHGPRGEFSGTCGINKKMKDYVEVVYNENERPVTTYPDKLAYYLFKRFGMQAGDKLLDNGCGRGDFLSGFAKLGLKCYGTDISMHAKDRISGFAEFYMVNIESGLLPFNDNFFDIVFTKSVIEHFYNPSNFIQECYRVLKPGGRIIIMTPDWKTTIFIFYDDPTHVHPYTCASIRELLILNGFRNVATEMFYQLPILWKCSWLRIFARCLQLFGPVKRVYTNKFIRWSRELMVLGTGVK